MFFFYLNSKSYPSIVPDVVPLGFWSGWRAIRWVSYHFQEPSFPTPLLYENHAEKNSFQWKQKAYPIWKLEWSDSDPVRWRHSIKRLDSNLKLYKYNTVNLLSCITLDIEYFHFAAHFKQQSLARVIESTISRS